MENPPDPLTIGRMARRTGLTAKALRHYDRIGLLAPAVVDPATGYRFYAAGQVAQARLVQLLRSVDLPLEQVRECLATPDDEAHIQQVLAAHRRRLQARLDRVRGDLHRLDHLIKDGVGTTMADITTTTSPGTTAAGSGPEVAADERRLAADLFNGVWRLLEKEDRSVDDDDTMLHMAHASRYHWGQVGAPVNRSRGEWQVSRVYAVLGRAEPATYHAQRGLAICQAAGIGDWDLAFAYESLARAAAVSGDAEQARLWTEQALAAAEEIAEDEDRELVISDLESIPGQPRFW
jgi:DNA-binding transcriptional MerR regulator